MNHSLITALPPDTQDLWSACISSHNTIDKWELKGQTFTNFICALLCNYGTWSYEPRLSTHHAMHKVHMRSNLPFMCPVSHTILYMSTNTARPKCIFWQDILIRSLNYISFLQSSLSTVDRKKILMSVFVK